MQLLRSTNVRFFLSSDRAQSVDESVFVRLHSAASAGPPEDWAVNWDEMLYESDSLSVALPPAGSRPTQVDFDLTSALLTVEAGSGSVVAGDPPLLLEAGRTYGLSLCARLHPAPAALTAHARAGGAPMSSGVGIAVRGMARGGSFSSLPADVPALALWDRGADPSPSESASPGVAVPSLSPSGNISVTASGTGTASAPPMSVSPPPAGNASASESLTASATDTPTATVSGTQSHTGSPSGQPSLTASGSGTPSGSPSAASATETPTAGGAPSGSSSPSGSPVGTGTPSVSGSAGVDPTGTPTETATPSATPSPSETLPGGASPSPTGSVTPSASWSETPSGTRSGTETETASPSYTASSTSTPSSTGSIGASPSVTPSSSGSPSLTSSPTPTSTKLPSWTSTPRRTASPLRGSASGFTVVLNLAFKGTTLGDLRDPALLAVLRSELAAVGGSQTSRVLLGDPTLSRPPPVGRGDTLGGASATGTPSGSYSGTPTASASMSESPAGGSASATATATPSQSGTDTPAVPDPTGPKAVYMVARILVPSDSVTASAISGAYERARIIRGQVLDALDSRDTVRQSMGSSFRLLEEGAQEAAREAAAALGGGPDAQAAAADRVMVDVEVDGDNGSGIEARNPANARPSEDFGMSPIVVGGLITAAALAAIGVALYMRRQRRKAKHGIVLNSGYTYGQGVYSVPRSSHLRNLAKGIAEDEAGSGAARAASAAVLGVAGAGGGVRAGPQYGAGSAIGLAPALLQQQQQRRGRASSSGGLGGGASPALGPRSPASPAGGSPGAGPLESSTSFAPLQPNFSGGSAASAGGGGGGGGRAPVRPQPQHWHEGGAGALTPVTEVDAESESGFTLGGGASGGFGDASVASTPRLGAQAAGGNGDAMGGFAPLQQQQRRAPGQHSQPQPEGAIVVVSNVLQDAHMGHQQREGEEYQQDGDDHR